MADLTALKQSIAAAIRANGEGAITGPVLQDQLLDMVDAMEVDTFGGFLTADTVPPTDTTVPHVFIGYGEFTNEAFQIGVQRGEVWIVCRMADEEEWTKVNLTSNLLNRVQALEEGTQAKLTEGDGIDIDAEGNISTKIGTGLKYDNEGNMEVDTDTVATNTSVEEYINGQKGAANGLASLDAEGKVNELPDDVAHFTEDGIDETAIINEYNRILALLYQSVADVEGYVATVSAAVNRAIAAAENAEAKGVVAQRAAEETERIGQEVDAKGRQAEQSAQNADRSAQNADRATESVGTAIAGANQAAARANTAAAASEEAAREANALLPEMRQAKNNANSAAETAEQKGDYAKDQGDAAKAIVEGSKGDYASLNDRLNAIETGKQDVIEDLSTIRSNAEAGSTAYQKPVGGIPASDLSSSVNTSLQKANSAYQLPINKIPKSDLSEQVQELLDNGIVYVEDNDFSAIIG